MLNIIIKIFIIISFYNNLYSFNCQDITDKIKELKANNYHVLTIDYPSEKIIIFNDEDKIYAYITNINAYVYYTRCYLFDNRIIFKNILDENIQYSLLLSDKITYLSLVQEFNSLEFSSDNYDVSNSKLEYIHDFYSKNKLIPYIESNEEIFASIKYNNKDYNLTLYDTNNTSQGSPHEGGNVVSSSTADTASTSPKEIRLDHDIHTNPKEHKLDSHLTLYDTNNTSQGSPHEGGNVVSSSTADTASTSPKEIRLDHDIHTNPKEHKLDSHLTLYDTNNTSQGSPHEGGNVHKYHDNHLKRVNSSTDDTASTSKKIRLDHYTDTNPKEHNLDSNLTLYDADNTQGSPHEGGIVVNSSTDDTASTSKKIKLDHYTDTNPKEHNLANLSPELQKIIKEYGNFNEHEPYDILYTTNKFDQKSSRKFDLNKVLNILMKGKSLILLNKSFIDYPNNIINQTREIFFMVLTKIDDSQYKLINYHLSDLNSILDETPIVYIGNVTFYYKQIINEIKYCLIITNQDYFNIDDFYVIGELSIKNNKFVSSNSSDKQLSTSSSSNSKIKHSIQELLNNHFNDGNYFIYNYDIYSNIEETKELLNKIISTNRNNEKFIFIQKCVIVNTTSQPSCRRDIDFGIILEPQKYDSVTGTTYDIKYIEYDFLLKNFKTTDVFHSVYVKFRIKKDKRHLYLELVIINNGNETYKRLTLYTLLKGDPINSTIIN